MKIGIFTPRSIDPLHPRLAAFIEYFNEKSLLYDFITVNTHPLFSRINWVSLFFFDLWSVFVNRKKPGKYDLVLINDLKFLPIAKHGRHYGKTVIYETIDNNVSLRMYSLQKKIPFTRYFSVQILNHFSRKEKMLVSKYCNDVIVNSGALAEYFSGNAEILFYYSAFEKIKVVNNFKNTPALLYIGEFSEEKGATEILELRKQLNIELFVFGNVASEKIKSALNDPMISHTCKIGLNELTGLIETRLGTNYLVGVSFIKPLHFSYATQEANKDIDYLALGVPIIGNHRLLTEEKILAGCGIFPENEKDLSKLLTDEGFRQELSQHCINYYDKKYSKDIFTKGMDRVFCKYLH